MRVLKMHDSFSQTSLRQLNFVCFKQRFCAFCNTWLRKKEAGTWFVEKTPKSTIIKKLVGSRLSLQLRRADLLGAQLEPFPPCRGWFLWKPYPTKINSEFKESAKTQWWNWFSSKMKKRLAPGSLQKIATTFIIKKLVGSKLSLQRGVQESGRDPHRAQLGPFLRKECWHQRGWHLS